MQIEEQIKVLLRTKAKIDLYRNVVKYVTTEGSATNEEFNVAYPGLAEEFATELTSMCNARIEALGNPVKAPETKVVIPTEPPKPPVPPEPPVNNGDPTDPLLFLKKYRHLDNKRVSYASKDGEVKGTVKGMVAPFLRIQLDTGYVLNCEPSRIKEI